MEQIYNEKKQNARKKVKKLPMVVKNIPFIK